MEIVVIIIGLIAVWFIFKFFMSIRQEAKYFNVIDVLVDTVESSRYIESLGYKNRANLIQRLGYTQAIESIIQEIRDSAVNDLKLSSAIFDIPSIKAREEKFIIAFSNVHGYEDEYKQRVSPNKELYNDIYQKRGLGDNDN